MRVAVLGSRHILSNYSGIERGLQNCLPHLVERGHEVTVFGGPAPERLGGEAVEWRGVRSVPVRGLAGKHSETLVRTAASVALAVKGGFDVLLFTHQGPGVFCPVARIAGVPTVVWVQGLDWQRAKWGRAASAMIWGAERVAVRTADAIMVPSRPIGRYFAETYGRDTFHVPGGIAAQQPLGSTEWLDAQGLRPEGYALFAARLVPEKGCHDLIAAWNGVRTDKKLVVAGSGRYDADYVRSLRAMADPDKVAFVGHVSGAALQQLFGGAYLFVLPSYIEGQSVALLEAIGFGRAVLVSDIPESQEAVEIGGASFRVGDVDDLRAELSRLLADPAEVGRMRRAAERAARAWPTWREVAAMHEEVYLAAREARRRGGAARSARANG